MRRLYVTKKTVSEVQEAWQIPIIMREPFYVRCNKVGFVLWRTTALYSVEELIERDNVKIIK